MGFSLSLRVGDGISTSFCLSEGGQHKGVRMEDVDGGGCTVPDLLEATKVCALT